MNLAVRDIRHNLGRFVLTAVGIGLLLLTVTGMGGIYRGIVEDATLVVDRIDADLWVVQRDTRGPFAELSRVPRNLVHRVLAVRGVEDAREFIYHTVQREHDGRPLRIALLGLDWPRDDGGWLPIVAGRPLGRAHYEIVADRSLGLALGQAIRLGKDAYEVVGLMEGMVSSSGDGLACVALADAQAIQFDLAGEAVRLEREARGARGAVSDVGHAQPGLLELSQNPSTQLPAVLPPSISAVLVRLSAAHAAPDVVETIGAFADVSVYTRDAQRALLLEGSVEKVRQQIGLFRLLLTVIAAIIMALILYTLTLDKLHSIALLKLIGAPNRVILAMILQQALVLGAAGYAVALVVGRQLFPHFPRRVILGQDDLIQLGFVVLVISVLASVLGIARALRVSANEALS